MKYFIFNTAKGKRFYTEVYGFIVGNSIPANIEIFQSFLQVKFERNFMVDNDILCAIMNFARRYDMLIEMYACCDCILMHFSID